MAGVVNKVYSVFRYTTISLLSPQSQLVNYAWQINKRTNKNLFYQQYEIFVLLTIFSLTKSCLTS